MVKRRVRRVYGANTVRLGVLVCSVLVGACGSGSDELTLDPPHTGDGSIEVPQTTSAEERSVDPSNEVEQTDTAPEWTVGDSWVNASANLEGLPSECGNLAAVTAHPERDEVYVGVALQGLWVSRDGDASWDPLGRAEGSATIDNRMTSIVFDPEDQARFWESGIYGAGVYRSNDSGGTFRQLGDVAHVDLVSIDLTDPDRQTMLAGIHEQSVVMLSRDGGATWSDVSAGLPADIGHASSPHILDAATFLLGTKNGPASGVFRSDDTGQTWSQVFDMGVVGAPIISGDGTITWLLGGGLGIVTSTDSGMTWTPFGSRGAIDKLTSSLVELPGGELLTVGNGRLVLSGDRGMSWKEAGPMLPYRPAGVAYAPARGAVFAWTFDCDFSGDNPIRSDSIIRLDLAPLA